MALGKHSLLDKVKGKSVLAGKMKIGSGNRILNVCMWGMRPKATGTVCLMAISPTVDTHDT